MALEPYKMLKTGVNAPFHYYKLGREKSGQT